MFGLTLLKKTTPSHRPDEVGIYVIDNKKITYTIQRKAKRRRKIALYIDAPGKLRFIAPLRTKTVTIENILKDRGAWITSKLEKTHDHSAPQFPDHFEDGSEIFFLGKKYLIQIENDKRKAEACRREGAILFINLHDKASSSETDIRLLILLFYKKEARALLKERTDYWAQKLGLHYKSLKVTSPHRQWGSCSYKNDIRLNWRVIIASLDAIDYLVVHELCHIVHKNHSPKFWELVAKAIPDHKNRRKLLRHIDPGFSV